MEDSWPGAPPWETDSDSLSSHAAELERTLRALEAIEAFRAEAAALRAELLAARAPRLRETAYRRPSVQLAGDTWRLIVEAAFIVAVAVVARVVHLDRLRIVLAMAGAWLLVAVLEAVAWRRSESAWPSPAAMQEIPVPPARPATPLPLPPPLAARPPVLPPPQPVGWPSRSELVAEPPAEAEPAPVEPAVAEPEEKPEPVLVAAVEEEPDGGPAVGAFAALEEHAAGADSLQAALAPRPPRLRRLGRLRPRRKGRARI